MDEPITAFDLGRMFFGDEPPLFLLEIVVRTVLIYVYSLGLIRWIGSRPIAQLSLVEFLLVIALGSAVGDSMFYPDVPIVHCMLVITVVILLDKVLSFLVSRSPTFEDLIEGRSVQLVKDGLIRPRDMEKLNFGHDELFEQLRLNGVENLGEVRAAYLETNGLLSVFKAEKADRRPGLSIDPPWDVKEPRKLIAGHTTQEGGPFACARCAAVTELPKAGSVPRCPHCGGAVWYEVER